MEKKQFFTWSIGYVTGNSTYVLLRFNFLKFEWTMRSFTLKHEGDLHRLCQAFSESWFSLGHVLCEWKYTVCLFSQNVVLDGGSHWSSALHNKLIQTQNGIEAESFQSPSMSMSFLFMAIASCTLWKYFCHFALWHFSCGDCWSVIYVTTVLVPLILDPDLLSGWTTDRFAKIAFLFILLTICFILSWGNVMYWCRCLK